MKNLFAQIMKFGMVGVVCFGIDYIIGYSVMKIMVKLGGEPIFEIASMAGSALGFTVSVIINYILSFRFVFERKEDLDRRKEFAAFIILSVIGLGLNDFFSRNIFLVTKLYTITTAVAITFAPVYARS